MPAPRKQPIKLLAAKDHCLGTKGKKLIQKQRRSKRDKEKASILKAAVAARKFEDLEGKATGVKLSETLTDEQLHVANADEENEIILHIEIERLDMVVPPTPMVTTPTNDLDDGNQIYQLLETPSDEPTCAAEAAERQMTDEIIIHLDIEHTDTVASAASAKKHMAIAAKTTTAMELHSNIYENCTPVCLSITPLTPQSPLFKTFTTATASNALAMHASCLQQALQLPYENDPDLLAYFRERELYSRPQPNYLQQQPQIDRAARAFLIDWLMSIVRERQLDTEILYLAVSYIDRFLSVVVVQRSKLQVVGLACLHIALKFDISCPPRIAKLAATGKADLDAKQVVQMEELILKALSYDLRLPTAFTFVNAFAAATKLSELLKHLAMYICELTLLETEPYLQFLPSRIAAAAYALARYILGYEIWSQQLVDVTSCALEELKQIFLCLSRTHSGAPKMLTKAIQIKYLEKEYYEVALVPAVCVNGATFDYLVEHFYNLAE